MSKLEIVIGGVDTGKSAWAEARLLQMSGADTPLYIATLPPTKRFEERIERHRVRRAQRWSLIEVNGELGQVWQSFADGRIPRCILLDGLIALANRRLLVAGDALEKRAIEAQGLMSNYKDFLGRIVDETERTIVVTTIVAPSSTARMTRIDAESLELNAMMVEMTCEVGAVAWHSTPNGIERVTNVKALPSNLG